MRRTPPRSSGGMEARRLMPADCVQHARASARAAAPIGGGRRDRDDAGRRRTVEPARRRTRARRAPRPVRRAGTRRRRASVNDARADAGVRPRDPAGHARGGGFVAKRRRGRPASRRRRHGAADPDARRRASGRLRVRPALHPRCEKRETRGRRDAVDRATTWLFARRVGRRRPGRGACPRVERFFTRREPALPTRTYGR